MMIKLVLAFLFGDLLVQTLAVLPSILIIAILWMGALLLYMLSRWCRYYPSIFLWIFIFVTGFVYTVAHAQYILSWTLPKQWEGKPLLVTGTVASLPTYAEWQTQFILAIDQAQYGHHALYGRTLIHLASRNNEIFHVGDQWQLRVKLKRLHATENPGCFDIERSALQTGLRAQGYILPSPNNHFIKHCDRCYWLDQKRENLKERIKKILPHSAVSPWLMALMIGERNNIDASDWQVLSRTGTNHLMAIAGLHIGLIASFFYVLSEWLWKRVPRLLLSKPTQEVGKITALITAGIYSGLSGFSLPTARAFIMLTSFIIAMLLRRKINSWQAWIISLAVMLITNPLCVLTESFWLSYITLVIIIFGMHGRIAPTGWWWKHGRMQVVIGFGLIPVSLLIYQQCSIVAVLANLFAVPWLGFCVLPFCFLSTLTLACWPQCASWLLYLANYTLSILWWWLTSLSHLSFSVWQPAVASFAILISMMIGCIALLLPFKFPGRWLGLLWVMPVFFQQAPHPLVNEIFFTLLDVGQGLAVVVQTQSHVLVYDAGAKYPSHNMGESVVMPYLKNQGITKIDKLVISHADNDHAGGAQSIIEGMPVSSTVTSDPRKLVYTQAAYCMAGEHWQWDGINFDFLYPEQEDLNLGNDSSCVLRIKIGEHVILLPGDIEKRAEMQLLARYANQLKSTILVAPHHGSKTSGWPGFIAAVHPQIVLFATGYRNRYHFPHERVSKSYAAIHAQLLSTAQSGAIQINIDHKSISKLTAYRMDQHRYWMESDTVNPSAADW